MFRINLFHLYFMFGYIKKAQGNILAVFHTGDFYCPARLLECFWATFKETRPQSSESKSILGDISLQNKHSWEKDQQRSQVALREESCWWQRPKSQDKREGDPETGPTLWTDPKLAAEEQHTRASFSHDHGSVFWKKKQTKLPTYKSCVETLECFK